jgi:hypothetical protein
LIVRFAGRFLVGIDFTAAEAVKSMPSSTRTHS